MPIRFLFALFIPFSLISNEIAREEPIPLFDPPAGWECAFPDNLSPCIQVGFLGKGSTPFRPSINLAVEEVDVNLKQYLKAVKEIHLADKGTVWRDLGKFKTRSGEGRLLELSANSPLGPIKMLQMITIVGKTAYILTGAAIKDDFLKFQEVFMKTFQSLSLAKDLFNPLPEEKKKRFEHFFSDLGQSVADEAQKQAKWNDLQKMVVQEAPEMGNYWQILVLKTGREKLYP